MYAHRLRVLYADTDNAGIVYHANYLRFFEAARNELLRERGLPYREIEAMGYVWPVVETHLRYRQPARYDDLLRVTCWVESMGHAQATFAYEVVREEPEGGETRLCEGSTRIACVRRGGHVAPMPPEVRRVLEAARRPDLKGNPPRRRA